MVNKSYSKNKGRGKGRGHFLALFDELVRGDEYAQLSPKAAKLIIDIGTQYNGSNNGDLTAAFGYMKKHGWKSEATLRRAINELEQAGFIEKTRQGSKRICNLYAITWQPIDDCDGKLDVSATKTPSNKWKNKSRTPVLSVKPNFSHQF